MFDLELEASNIRLTKHMKSEARAMLNLNFRICTQCEIISECVMLNSYSQSGKVSSNHLHLSSHNCRQYGNLMQIAAERSRLQLDMTQVRISLGIKNGSRPGHIWKSNQYHLLHNQHPTIKHALYSLQIELTAQYYVQ